MQNGEYSDALILAQQLTLRYQTLLGPRRRTVLAVKFVHAAVVFVLGDLDKGLTGLDNAVEEAASALGPLDTAVTSRNVVIINFLADSGMVDEARRRLVTLQNTYSGFPQDHLVKFLLEAAAQNLSDPNSD